MTENRARPGKNRARPGKNRARPCDHRARRLRGALLALTAAGGLLLTGCSASDGGHGSASNGANRSGGATGRLPAPAPAQSAGTAQDSRQGDQKGPNRELTPSPDFLSTFALDVDTASYGFARRTL